MGVLLKERCMCSRRGVDIVLKEICHYHHTQMYNLHFQEPPNTLPAFSRTTAWRASVRSLLRPAATSAPAAGGAPPWKAEEEAEARKKASRQVTRTAENDKRLFVNPGGSLCSFSVMFRLFVGIVGVLHFLASPPFLPPPLLGFLNFFTLIVAPSFSMSFHTASRAAKRSNPAYFDPPTSLIVPSCVVRIKNTSF